MATNFSEKNSQVISGISQLQTKERELYATLEDNNLSTDYRKSVIDQINNLSQLRMNMYSELQNMYSSYQENADNLNTTLNVQFKSINQIEDELNQSKVYLNSVDQLKIDKLRVVEINNYYAKRYDAYKNIMFLISISCIPILALTVLNNNSIIPSSIYQIIIGLIVSIASYFIFKQYADISNRDDINWDSYEWYFNKSKAPKPEDSSASNESTGDEYVETTDTNVDCIGSSCCQNGTIYDDVLKQCVNSATTSS